MRGRAWGGMTQYPAEHIASTVYLSLPSHPAQFSAAEVRSLMAQAINADRAQHDLSSARDIIDRHGARAVIWQRADIESVLDARMKRAGADASRTQTECDAIVDRALQSPYWSGLDECTDRDWLLIDLALDDAIGDA